MNGKISSSKFLLLLSSVTFFFSCTNNSKNDEAFKILDESLIGSNQILNRSNQNIYMLLKDKLSDPSTHYKAEIWYPKAELIQKLSTDIADHIEKLKSNVRKEGTLQNSEANKFYQQLINYKEEVMLIDSEMTAVFDTRIIITTRVFDSIQKNNQGFYKTFFYGLSKEALLSTLSKFQNNIIINENKLLMYCLNKIPSYNDGYDLFSAFVGQSANYLRAGDNIEITAGVGAFSRTVEPKIFINGKSIELNNMALAITKIKTSKKPGKHFIPVQITYIDQDGKEQTIMKNAEYTVVDY